MDKKAEGRGQRADRRLKIQESFDKNFIILLIGFLSCGTDGGDGAVTTRRAYGTSKFADDASLKVGKDYSPVTRFLSGQVFGADAGLLGIGDFYGRRPGQIGLQIGGFEFAAITNALNGNGYRVTPATGPPITAPGVIPAGSDPDWNIPKLEASWMLKFGSFDIRPFGGFQYFKVNDTLTTRQAGTLTDDVDVYSYVVGLDAMLNIGAFYIGAQGSYGMNQQNANWSGPLVGGSAGSFALLEGGDDVKDTTTWMAMLCHGIGTIRIAVKRATRRRSSAGSGMDRLPHSGAVPDL